MESDDEIYNKKERNKKDIQFKIGYLNWHINKHGYLKSYWELIIFPRVG
jgi:hypothetical protein